MLGFNDRTAVDKNGQYYDRYFVALDKIYKERPRDYARKFFMYLKPLHERFEEIVHHLNDVRIKLPESQNSLIKQINEEIDRTERKIKVHALARKHAKI